MNKHNTQHNRLNAYFTKNVFARSYELVAEGIDRKTIQGAVESGNLRKIGNGLYQAIDASLDFNMSFAVAVGLRFLIWYNKGSYSSEDKTVAVGLRFLIWYNDRDLNAAINIVAVGLRFLIWYNLSMKV